MSKPWLLLDVDGVLNVTDTSNKQARRAGLRTIHVTPGDGLRYKIHYNPDLHHWVWRARAAGFQLAWCTTWQDYANWHLADRLWLPEMPVVRFNKHREGTKVHGILEFLEHDPFVWIDDEITEEDQLLLDRLHRGPRNLVHTDPSVGMTETHVDDAINWANENNLLEDT